MIYRRGVFTLWLFVAPLLAGPAFALSKLDPIGPPAAPTVIAPNPSDKTLVPEGSEVKREQLSPIETVPLPAPITNNPGVSPDPEVTGPSSIDATDELPASDDLALLPEPVKRMRELLVAAAKTGDIEALRPLISVGAETTQLSVTEIEGDAIAYLKGQAGDADGQEILAIMLDLLETKFVQTDAGSTEELYVWPYFVGRELEELTPPERVDLFRIVTAGDYEDMKVFGAYNFYRIGISPEGRFVFFVSGD